MIRIINSQIAINNDTDGIQFITIEPAVKVVLMLKIWKSNFFKSIRRLKIYGCRRIGGQSEEQRQQ